MRYLICTASDERDNVVNSWYTTNGTSSALVQLLQAVVAHMDDDKEEDPDSYWHP